MYSCVVYVTNRTKSPTCRKTVHRKTHGAVEQDIHWFGFRTSTSQKILVQLQSLALETPTVEFPSNELKRLACEQALWGAVVMGWEKNGEFATTSLELFFFFFLPIYLLIITLNNYSYNTTEKTL